MLSSLPEILSREFHDRFLGRFFGRFWLTERRLVWRPSWRVPIHIPLHAIRPGGVRRFSERNVQVSLADGRHFNLKPLDAEDAKRLVTLLQQHCPDWGPGEAYKLVN